MAAARTRERGAGEPAAWEGTLYMDYPEQSGTRCLGVLSLEDDFAPHLVETLLSSSSESTTAAPLVGALA